MHHEDDILEIFDAAPRLDTSYISFSSKGDDGLRSPRTPTYTPVSISQSDITPFDPTRMFYNSQSQAEKAAAPPPTPPTPTKPLDWIWRCHLCRSRYPLGVTRRCLLDGHYYCAGETDRPNLKKKRKGMSCSSDFDYFGWREWGDWRGKVMRNNGNLARLKAEKGCQKCEFPSQCRYTSKVVVDDGDEAEDAEDLMDDIDLSSPLASGGFRFYDSEKITSKPTLETEIDAAEEKIQSKVTDFFKPEIGKSPTSATLDRIIKSAERRSAKKALLSPIQEEFLKTEVEEHGLMGVMDFIAPVLDF